MRWAISFAIIIVIAYFLPAPTKTIHLIGHSMEPFGLYDGMNVSLYDRKPTVGDFVSFQCLKDGCPHVRMVKMLKEKNGDCFFFVGRDPYVNQDGEKMVSVDSRTYGWLCKNEIKIYGVVKV